MAAPSQAYVVSHVGIWWRQARTNGWLQKLGNATTVTNNPPGVVYRATFPKDPFFKSAYPDGGNVEGSVVATANPDGTGVIFSINWQNLPKAGGPFSASRYPLPCLEAIHILTFLPQCTTSTSHPFPRTATARLHSPISTPLTGPSRPSATRSCPRHAKWAT